MPKTITVTAKIKAPKHENEMYDRTQLANGIKIEREHTNNKQLAALIAKNHLDEDKDYYKKLKNMESAK